MFRKITWVLTLLGALSGGYVALSTVLNPTAANVCAGCAFGLASGILPYVLARAVDELRK
jgi:hypothetical protein